MSDTMILNGGDVPENGIDKRSLSGELRSTINRLKSEFYDLEQGKVNYAAMRGSEAYEEYVVQTRRLQTFEPSLLETRSEKLAFWINLYNTLVIHGAVALDIRKSVKDVHGFFQKIAYLIGSESYTPDDIEHGILRGNARCPHGIFHPFSSSDPRRKHVITPTDPRIHFTLVCGSASCPPINFYTPERIEAQLEVAAAGFINGPEVEILPSENLLKLSPIFKWYRPDFGGHEGVIDLLIRYIDHGPEKMFLIERGMGADIEWKEYDWSLNH